jgi:replicative DNA helicase
MILLGAPGKGKTTLANQWAERVANGGRPVLYVTLEDPAFALLAKTMARVCELDYGDVLHGKKEAREKIDDALAKVASRRSSQRLLYWQPTGRLSLAEMEERARVHFARFGPQAGGGPGLLVLDYLQKAARSLVSSGAQGELRLAVSALTDQLGGLAQALDCTVLAIGSQNRSGYVNGNNGSPLASAKESGDIEYGCDVLAAIIDDKNRALVTTGCKPVGLYVAKNRLGESEWTLALDWMPVRQQFTETQVQP